MAGWNDPRWSAGRRADAGYRRTAHPVICGHSGEAPGNLAEAALHRGFTEVRIVTWPLDLPANSLGPPSSPSTASCPTARVSRWRGPGAGG